MSAFILLWIAPLLKVDQTELVSVIKTVLDGFDSTNAYLRQNIPGLVEETKKIQEINDTLPKHADKIAEV